MRLMMMIIKISIISNIITLLKDGVINTGDWHCVDGTGYPFLASPLSPSSLSS